MEGTAQGSAAQEHGARLLELWNWDGTLEHVHHALYVAVREQAGREASPPNELLRGSAATATWLVTLNATPQPS
jgi:hypothetical protein